MSQSQIVKMVRDQAGVGRNTTLAVLKRLADQGKLTARPGGPPPTLIYERS